MIKKKTLLFFIVMLLGITSYTETDTITFSADTVKASIAENKKTTNLIGNAKVKVGNLEISSNSIEIFGKDYRFVNATGSVKGEDSEKGYSFTADFIKFDRKTDIVLMFGKIELNDTKNNVKISGENVEYKKKAEIMIMRFNVKIEKKDILCNSMFALYNRKESGLELTGNPLVKKGKDEFKATKISVNLDTEDISLDGRVSGSVEEQTEKQEDTDEEAKDNEKKDAEDSTEDSKKENSEKDEIKKEESEQETEKNVKQEEPKDSEENQ